MTTTLNRSTLSYVYDFGDYWGHCIKVTKGIAPIPEFVLPFCAGGACATPSRDCVGAPGHAEFVRAMVNPGDPENDTLVK